MKKGFTYIVTTMLLIILISGVVIVSNYNAPGNKINPVAILAKNYENEFLNILNSGSSVEDINQFNYRFKKFINSNNYDSKLCNLITTENGIIASNFMDQNCDLMINGVSNQTITENNTIITDIFINDTNIYLCNCYYKAGENIYYIDIYNENSKTTFKN
ncbi:MAG TPA: hypothetical protein PLK55_00645 [archaeon]|nr:hypothetical protein [archaeon]